MAVEKGLDATEGVARAQVVDERIRPRLRVDGQPLDNVLVAGVDLAGREQRLAFPQEQVGDRHHEQDAIVVLREEAAVVDGETPDLRRQQVGRQVRRAGARRSPS